MMRAAKGVAVSSLAGVSALAGAVVSAAALAGLILTAAILNSSILGTYTLVAMAQLDGIALIVDRELPISTFKIVSVLLLISLILTLSRNPILWGRPRLSPAMLLSLLFAVWVMFSYLVSDYRDEAREHTVGFLQTMLLVPFIGLTVASTAQLRRLLLIIAVSGAISAMFVILETMAGLRVLPHANINDIANWRGAVRSAGASAYNPTTSSHLIVVSAMIAMTMSIHDRPRWGLWAVLALTALAALPMMGARSGILALMFGLLILGFSMRKHYLFPVFLGVSVLIALAALPLVPAALWERFTVLGSFFDDGNTSDRTLLRRLSYNLIGLELWGNNPITGVGPGVFPTFYASDEFRWLPGRGTGHRQLHNAYLEVAAETGTVGLLLFLGAVLSAARMAMRWGAKPVTEARVLAKAVGIALTVFLVASLFMPNEDNKYMWILTALCARAAWLCKRADQLERPFR
jgi:O-antigen ligase